jgi:transcriptional regulator with XRE-family HTH domain
MDSRTPFGEWLRHRRKLFDLTQKRLADQVGCSRVTIRKLEAGERKPSRQMAAILATVLEIPDREHEAFVRFARSDDFNASFSIPMWQADHPSWRESQLPAKRPDNVVFRSGMTSEYEVVSTARPEYVGADDGRLLFKAVSEGRIWGDFEGIIKLDYTQVVWPKPKVVNIAQASPMRVAASFRVEQGDGWLEGYCTGEIYPSVDMEGNGPARFQGAGQVISVSIGLIDYFLGRVFLEEDVKMVEGTGVGARGVLRVEVGVG